MEGASRSTKGKGERVKGGSRRRPFHKMQRRRYHGGGAKLASYSSSDGSPEHPVKVVVVGGDAGSVGDGSHVCIPVFGDGDQTPRSNDTIGESGPSFASVPKMAAGGGRLNEPVKLGVCDGGRSKEEAVKLGSSGSDGSPKRVVNIGRSGILTDSLGQLYVHDSEDEGTDMEDGGSCGVHRYRSAACARLAAARAAGKCEHAVVANLATQMAVLADPAPKVAMVVDVPMENDPAPVELRPELKVQLARMDPVLHGTFLTFLEILLPAYFNP